MQERMNVLKGSLQLKGYKTTVSVHTKGCGFTGSFIVSAGMVSSSVFRYTFSTSFVLFDQTGSWDAQRACAESANLVMLPGVVLASQGVMQVRLWIGLAL